MHGYIVINLTIVFAEIVNFAPNNYDHTFAPPLDEILGTPLRNGVKNYLLISEFCVTIVLAQLIVKVHSFRV